MTDQQLLGLMAAALGLAIGLIIGWAAQARTISAQSNRILTLESEAAAFEATLRSERDALAAVHAARTELQHSFDAMAARALAANNQAFLTLAQERMATLAAQTTAELDKRQGGFSELVQPVKDTLARLEAGIQAIETQREGAYQGLRSLVASMSEDQQRLRHETQALKSALTRPQGRGRWGELQLRRVAELAGMMAHCDFTEQTSQDGADGRLRPDMIIRLPEGRAVVVDAKTPLDDYMAAHEAADDATRQAALLRHARQVQNHLRSLSAKSYGAAVNGSIDIVVMFLPGEAYLSAAVDANPQLIEDAAARGVMLATPMTLIALLRAVAFGWRQQAMAENAIAVSKLGAELHDRIGKFTGHLAKLGDMLGRSTEHYNKAVASLESRVLVTARKLEALGIADHDSAIATPDLLEIAPRPITREDEPGHSISGAA